MTRFQELRRAGEDLTPKQVNETLRQLARDPRFAAVIAVIDRNAEAFESAANSQALADSHGKLAHAAGSHYALSVLRGQLQSLIDPRPRTTESAPD